MASPNAGQQVEWYIKRLGALQKPTILQVQLADQTPSLSTRKNAVPQPFSISSVHSASRDLPSRAPHPAPRHRQRPRYQVPTRPRL